MTRYIPCKKCSIKNPWELPKFLVITSDESDYEKTLMTGKMLDWQLRDFRKPSKFQRLINLIRKYSR